VLEIQLPAIHRARSAAVTAREVPQVDGGAGPSEDQVFMPSARRLRSVPASPPVDEGDAGFDPGPVPTDGDIVSIDEMLVWERSGAEDGPIHKRVGRLATLLGVAAVVIVVLILVFAAGTDVASVFRKLPGS
jgi:hypothetical protein